MKINPRRILKTEGSVEKEENNSRNYWELFSVSHRQKDLRRKQNICTPLRFADIALKIKQKSKDNKSTEDRQSPSKSKQNRDSFGEKFTNGCNYIQEHCSRLSLADQRTNKITPFQLSDSEEIFQEQMTFKGASNKLHLRKTIDEIEYKKEEFINDIKSLNYNSNLNFITDKLVKQSNKNNNNIKMSFYEFYTFLEDITKKLDDFGVELKRCKDIISITKGIAEKTMNFYQNRFHKLIKQMEENIKYLRNYIKILHELNRQTTSKHRKITGFNFNGRSK